LRDRKALKFPESFHVESRRARYTFYTLFCLIVADGVLTEFLVKGGHASELNPFMRALLGEGWFLAVKVAGAFLAMLLLWVNYNARPRLVYTITAVFLAFYTLIVLWNLVVFIITT
jgi:hypothetical protein